MIKFKVAMVSAAAGLILSWVNGESYGGFFSWFIVFGIGYGLGLLIHRTSEYKYGPKVAPIAVIFCLLGMLLNREVATALLLMVSGGFSSYLFMHTLVGAAIGTAGILVPILNSLRTR
ncbi:MAG: hypothetical protein AB7W16_26700 [Candidatus Obscuribacterales bacterium]